MKSFKERPHERTISADYCERLQVWATAKQAQPVDTEAERGRLEARLVRLKDVYVLSDLLLQHLDALEQEAEENGGVQQVLADHFAKVYKVSLSLAA